MIFSAHDTNLAQVGATLNFSSWQCQFDRWFKGSTDALNCIYKPYFAASIIMELYSDDENPNNKYIKIKFDGDYMNLCEKEQKTCEYN